MKQLTQSETRNTQLRLLDVFVAECEKHELEYFLYYGSLIGAIRHKGIIPWDDDIDLVMPRASYEKLKQIAWEKYDCEVVCPNESRTTPYLFSKLADKKTVLIENIESAVPRIGVNIDIFPLDYIGHPGLRSQAIMVLLKMLRVSQIIKTVKVSNHRAIAKNALLLLGKFSLLFLSANRIARVANHLVSKGGRYGLFGSLFGAYGHRELVDPDWVAEAVKVEFEKRILRAPCGYHEILTNLYGDYLKLPPLEKQVSHHSFIAYRR